MKRAASLNYLNKTSDDPFQVRLRKLTEVVLVFNQRCWVLLVLSSRQTRAGGNFRESRGLSSSTVDLYTGNWAPPGSAQTTLPDSLSLPHTLPLPHPKTPRTCFLLYLDPKTFSFIQTCFFITFLLSVPPQCLLTMAKHILPHPSPFFSASLPPSITALWLHLLPRCRPFWYIAPPVVWVPDLCVFPVPFTV